MNFATALFATGYMLPLIKGTEVVAGALLLSNRYVALALALLAPNIVNILLFHVFLAPGGTPVAIVFGPRSCSSRGAIATRMRRCFERAWSQQLSPRTRRAQ